MAATSSSVTPSGTPLPDFKLCDVVEGKVYANDSFAGCAGILVAFICRHCPYVVHMRDEFARIATEFEGQGIRTIGICSNDAVAYPDDAPERLREMRLRFPVLYDESQNVARAFGAVCTPDIFLYDASGRLFYRGRMDDSSPGNGRPVTGSELRTAIGNLLSGSPPPPDQISSIGCSIKWKKG